MTSEESTTTTLPPCAQDPVPIDPMTGAPYFCGPINEAATVTVQAVREETEATVTVPVPILTLPETGATSDALAVAIIFVVVGAILFGIKRLGRPDDHEE